MLDTQPEKNKLHSIKHFKTGKVLFSEESSSLKSFIAHAVKIKSSLAGAYLYKTNLSQECIQNIDFSNAFFTRSDLSYSSFKNVNMTETDLLGSDFSSSTLRSVEFLGANLMETNFKNSRLENVCFAYALLKGADFSGVRMEKVSFFSADLEGIKNYGNNFDIFLYLVKNKGIDVFTLKQWGIIALIERLDLSWVGIADKFGFLPLPILWLLGSEGFGEYLQEYKQAIKTDPDDDVIEERFFKNRRGYRPCRHFKVGISDEECRLGQKIIKDCQSCKHRWEG